MNNEKEVKLKKIKEEEYRRILKDNKYKELLKIQESFIISQFIEKLKNDEESDKINKKMKAFLKYEEESKIQNQKDIDFEESLKLDTEHVKIMEDIKIKNHELEIQNQKYAEQEEKQSFNSKEIISYLKTELETIALDDKELDNKDIESDKLNYIKEKYKVENEHKAVDPIVEDCLTIQENIYTHIKDIVSGNSSMIYTNLIYVITELMKFIENFNTEGVDKKQIIIKSIKQFLIDEQMNSEETDIILDTVCPELIDILLLVDKRKIIIRKKLNCFFPFCG
jgi:hypothetical protein